MRETLQTVWAIVAAPFCGVGMAACFIHDNVVLGWRMMEDWTEELWR